jgi:phage shock protein C
MARLARSSYDKKLFGVCSGLANYFGLDVTIIRLIFVLGFVFGVGSFGLIYIILLFVMPQD